VQTQWGDDDELPGTQPARPLKSHSRSLAAVHRLTGSPVGWSETERLSSGFVGADTVGIVWVQTPWGDDEELHGTSFGTQSVRPLKSQSRSLAAVHRLTGSPVGWSETERLSSGFVGADTVGIVWVQTQWGDNQSAWTADQLDVEFISAGLRSLVPCPYRSHVGVILTALRIVGENCGAMSGDKERKCGASKL
jgi:hypothetical protein